LDIRFPPLKSIDDLPDRVLVIAPHPDDEVLGCGGVLALHAQRGDRVRVVVLTDGAAGGDAEAREAETRAAATVLGLQEVEFMGLADGGLECDPDLVQRLSELLIDDDPQLVYAPSPYELHPDHLAAVHALAAALEGLGPRRVHLYGVNRQVPAHLLVDTSGVLAIKQEALARFDSQTIRQDLTTKSAAFDAAYTMNVDNPRVEAAEGFLVLDASTLREHLTSVARTLAGAHNGGGVGSLAAEAGLPSATAVISTWNKCEDVRANLLGLLAQTRPFDDIVVVDNASKDDTAEMIRTEFPSVRLIVMPHSEYGACETFNVGFASARTDLIAILDDDVVLPPNWLQRSMDRLLKEPETTAIVSTKIIEPGMPESYSASEAINTERYMSTFRGCASLARTRAVRQVGGYDERLFIYGNERDMTCRLLNLGYRVLQYPGAEAFHKTPFGVQLGKRSLYYHARNAWLGMLKYAPWRDLARMPWLVLTKVLLRGEKQEREGEVTDATGTIGIGRAVRETPGAYWILTKAACSVLWNVPYCLRRREPVTAPDFELPIH